MTLQLPQACDYLMSITTPEGGVPFAVAGVGRLSYPPWWVAPNPPAASENPTGSPGGAAAQAWIKHAWVESASEQYARPGARFRMNPIP